MGGVSSDMRGRKWTVVLERESRAIGDWSREKRKWCRRENWAVVWEGKEQAMGWKGRISII